jgi:hypothetical protein
VKEERHEHDTAEGCDHRGSAPRFCSRTIASGCGRCCSRRAKAACHRHVHDHLLLYAEPADIRATFEGRPVIQHVERGCVAYRAVGAGLPPHSITNVAETPSRHFIVELLGPSASDQPTALEHNGRARTEELAASLE